MPPLAGEQHADTVVVGAGLTGCLAAIELRRRGRKVILLEASTAGALEPRLGHVPVGPAAVYPPDADGRRAWPWMREGHERLKLAAARVGDVGYHANGGFLVATTKEEAAGLAEAEDELRDDTFSSEFLDHYMLEARFDVTGVVAALWMCDDGEIDAARLVRGLAQEAGARGARVFERSPVTTLEVSRDGILAATAHGRVHAADALVCAGEGTVDLLPRLQPLWRPTTLVVATFTSASPAVPSPVRLLGGGVSWRREGDVVRAAGLLPTADIAHVAAERDAVLARHLPVVRTHDGWAGTIASTRDGWPVVGRLEGLPVAVAAAYGDGALAWAPIAATWAAEALGGGADPTPAPLSPRRIARGDS